MTALLLALMLPAQAGPACALPAGWLPVDVDGNKKGCACVGLGRTAEGATEALVMGSCDVELTVAAAVCEGPVRLLLQAPGAEAGERRLPLQCASGTPLTGEIQSLTARRHR